jgi:hypothetical protein
MTDAATQERQLRWYQRHGHIVEDPGELALPYERNHYKAGAEPYVEKGWRWYDFVFFAAATMVGLTVAGEFGWWATFQVLGMFGLRP